MFPVRLIVKVPGLRRASFAIRSVATTLTLGFVVALSIVSKSVLDHVETTE